MTRPGLPNIKLLERQPGGGVIIAVGAVIGVVLATALIVLALGSTALAATGTGGVPPAAVPRIAGIACRTACVSADEAETGSLVRVRGGGLAAVARVVFLGGHGDGDDVSAGARRRDAKPGYLDVKVPSRARSGPVMVVTREGGESQASASGLIVLVRGGAHGGPARQPAGVGPPLLTSPGNETPAVCGREAWPSARPVSFPAGARRVPARRPGSGDPT